MYTRLCVDDLVMNRSVIYRVARVCVIVLSLAAGLSLGLGHFATISLPKPDPAYLPGQPFDGRHMYCDYDHVDQTDFFCLSVSYDDIVELIVNNHTGRIVSSTWYADRPLADYITQWGQPSGYVIDYSLVRVYWGTTSAWLTTKRFSPVSRVFLITYADRCTELLMVWHGFNLND